MLYRLETMILMGMEIPLPAVRRQIAAGIDIIVHLGRLHDKSRKVLEIVEVTGYEDGEIQTSVLFSLVGETLLRKEKLQSVQKLRNTGFLTEET